MSYSSAKNEARIENELNNIVSDLEKGKDLKAILHNVKLDEIKIRKGPALVIIALREDIEYLEKKLDQNVEQQNLLIKEINDKKKIYEISKEEYIDLINKIRYEHRARVKAKELVEHRYDVDGGYKKRKTRKTKKTYSIKDRKNKR